MVNTMTNEEWLIYIMATFSSFMIVFYAILYVHFRSYKQDMENLIGELVYSQDETLSKIIDELENIKNE